MIKNKIQSKLAKAFNQKLTDVVQEFSCSKVIKSGGYDPITQKYLIEESQTYSGRGVLFGSYKRDFIKPTDYQVEDSKATLLQNEVTAVPQINDVWSTGKGQFKVINVGADPAGVTYTVQIRKVSA